VVLHNFYIQILPINLILGLIRKFIKKSNFQCDWPAPSLIKAEQGINMGKRGFQEPSVVLYSFYIQILPINIISSHN